MFNTAELFPYPFRSDFEKPVAYFSMEFAIDQALKIYSGGLGFLARRPAAAGVAAHFVAHGAAGEKEQRGCAFGHFVAHRVDECIVNAVIAEFARQRAQCRAEHRERDHQIVEPTQQRNETEQHDRKGDNADDDRDQIQHDLKMGPFPGSDKVFCSNNTHSGRN